MTVYGVWHGGNNYAQPYTEDDLEEFNGLDTAFREFLHRYEQGHWASSNFEYVNKPGDTALTPNVDESANMRIYFADPTGNPDPYPDRIIEWDGKEFTINRT